MTKTTRKKKKPFTPDFIRGFEAASKCFVGVNRWTRSKRRIFNRVTRQMFGKKKV